jgi:hypothetical protein
MKRSSKLIKRNFKNIKNTKKGGASFFGRSSTKERELSPGTHLMVLDEQIGSLQIQISEFENDNQLVSVDAYELAQKLKRESYILDGIVDILKYAMQNKLFKQIGKPIPMPQAELRLVRQKIIQLYKRRKLLVDGINRFHEMLSALWTKRELVERRLESDYVNIVKKSKKGGSNKRSKKKKKSACI